MTKGQGSEGACSLLARSGGTKGQKQNGKRINKSPPPLLWRHAMRRCGDWRRATGAATPNCACTTSEHNQTRKRPEIKQAACSNPRAGDRPSLPALSGASARPCKQHDRAARPAAAMTGLPRAVAAAVASAAFLALVLPLARAQMVSPLQGQGRPNNSTRDVFFSMHLDRLLDGEQALPTTWGLLVTNGRSWRFAIDTTHAIMLSRPCRSG